MGQEPIHLKAFVKLGHLFREFCENRNDIDNQWSANLHDALNSAKIHNPWFTLENLEHSLAYWGQALTEKKLRDWLGAYEFNYDINPKTIGIIMAGNIPLVGFHDFLCVLFSGNMILAKLSDTDKVLLPFIKQFLMHSDPSLAEKIHFATGKLENFDAIIATGSNNTSRYFDHYFGKYPNIIRKNRNSVAVLTGNETTRQLEMLGEDVFRYFGLGCRSVSKIYVPEGYEFDSLFESLSKWKELADNHRYGNNYDYNKAVYLMSDFKFLDSGFFLLKEDESLSSPIATLNYARYSSLDELKLELKEKREALQCVVAEGFIDGEVNFGETQFPRLSDYADQLDTLKFLQNLI